MFSIFVEVPTLFVLSANEYTKEVKIKGAAVDWFFPLQHIRQSKRVYAALIILDNKWLNPSFPFLFCPANVIDVCLIY